MVKHTSDPSKVIGSWFSRPSEKVINYIIENYDIDPENGTIRYINLKPPRGTTRRDGDLVAAAPPGRVPTIVVQGWTNGKKSRSTSISCSRIIWWAKHDEWPRNRCYHRDGNPRNCRIDNLYMPEFMGNATQINSGKWEARIGVKKTMVSLYAFNTKEEAEELLRNVTVFLDLWETDAISGDTYSAAHDRPPRKFTRANHSGKPDSEHPAIDKYKETR